jgi:D-alanyl-D-alanine dipeptidase
MKHKRLLSSDRPAEFKTVDEDEYADEQAQEQMSGHNEGCNIDINTAGTSATAPNPSDYLDFRESSHPILDIMLHDCS